MSEGVAADGLQGPNCLRRTEARASYLSGGLAVSNWRKTRLAVFSLSASNRCVGLRRYGVLRYTVVICSGDVLASEALSLRTSAGPRRFDTSVWMGPLHRQVACGPPGSSPRTMSKDTRLNRSVTHEGVEQLQPDEVSSRCVASQKVSSEVALCVLQAFEFSFCGKGIPPKFVPRSPQETGRTQGHVDPALPGLCGSP